MNKVILTNVRLALFLLTVLSILSYVVISCGGGGGGGGGGSGGPVKSWGTPELIETAAMDAIAPQVAMDGSGTAFAVWYQNDGGQFNIWANRYVAGTGWGTAGLIETDNAGAALVPQVAMDGSGNAVAVWIQSDGARYNVRANRYSAAGWTWQTAVLIETNTTGTAYAPQVAMDRSENAVAVWNRSDGSRNDVWANRRPGVGYGWGTAGLIETESAWDAHTPQVAMDGSGNAVAVWYQLDGARFNIWANRYAAGTGWGTAEFIETDDVGSTYSPQVAMDGSGNAIAVWYQNDGWRLNIWANRYAAGTGWGTAGLIETDNAGDALAPQIAMDGSGNAVAVWRQHDGTRYNIWANRYAAGTGWGTAELIETDDAGSAYTPQVAMDGSGNAVAVWRQYDGSRYNIRANRYAAGTGWGKAVFVETDKTGNAENPQVAMDGSGNAIAVWEQYYDGPKRNIWANHFR